MPPLQNARHERFAQELAKGMTADEAYVAAGYIQSRSAASRLSTNVNIRARVAELKAGAAERAEITVADVLDGLKRIAKKGEDIGEAPGLSVARAALVDLGKHLGMFVDKVEHSGAVALTPTININGKSG